MTAANMHPKLNTTTEHLTVVEGGTATLPCTVQSMGDQVVFESEYQVIWISPKKTMISMGDRRLMDDLRMSVERPYISVWNLLIRNIRHNDTGYYECRINTSPVQTNKVFLDVKVPPAIVSQMSSDTIVLAVGQTATLVCNVTGIPQPNVTWYKRNHKGTSNIKEKIGSEGEVLIIHNVSRNCDDIYECYVDNGVPPAVSKAIRVVVKYAPEVHLQHPKRLGQYSGKETVLDCLIQANPLSITGWLVNGQIITKSDKYDIEILNEVENRLNLALRIRDISPSEFGTYECFASNFLGEDKEEMFLFELTSTSTTTTTSSTAATDTTVSRKQPPHNNRPGDQKSAEHSRPNYNSIDRQDNPPNVTPANSKSIERTKTSTTPATFTTPGFVQTTTIFRKRTPDKATRASVTMTAANMHPKLNTTTEHLTVVEGGTATLPCTVQSMGDQVVFESEYQVIWISPKKTMISMGDRRLMDDLRMSVERPYISVWNLLIRNIRHNDTGYYECRINTSPVQTNKVFLDVKVPPAIVSQMSSDTIVLAVGQTATLVCNVTGIPQPNVTWYKRNHKGTSNIKEKIGSEGEVLIIHNVSRNCDDIYECYVDNGVPPAVSKAIRVVVKYAPEVHLQHPKRLGQYSGKETVLDCLIQANPLSITGWLVNGQIITKSDKYDIEILNEVENRLNLALRIRDISPSEFGTYECFASNFLGEDKEEMFLFELTSTSTTTTTSSTAATDTTVSRKQPPHNNRPGDQKSAEHSRPNYNSIDRQDNPPNVTPANSKSIERTKTSTTPATFTTPAFVQTTTIFRERTPDKATRGHHAKTTVERPGRPILICQLGRTRSTLRRTRLKLCRTRPTLRRTTPTLPSNM